MIAIIIPYYKRSFFKATLQSLANQTDKRFNVYIGDDSSPESCENLLNQFEGQFVFEYHRFELNLGSVSLTQQWDRCIELSNTEEWLMVLGDDDVLGENVVEEFYKTKGLLNLEKINVLKFSSIIIDELGKYISKIYMHSEMEKTTEAYYKHFIGENRSSLSEYVFRRTSYNQFKFTDFPLAWHSDDKAWLDFTECGFLYSCNEAVVQVRMSSQNISGDTGNKYLKRHARMLFFEDIIKNKIEHFTNKQKKDFLFEYGILIKELNKINLNRVSLIFFNFLKIGYFYSSLKFLRRIYLIK